MGALFWEHKEDLDALSDEMNAWPFAVRLALGVVSGLLSLVIAVTVILAYQQTVPEDQMITWGTNLDLVTAFALGVLAHRVVQSLRPASEDLMSCLEGEKKPDAAEGEASAKNESGTTESGATVATKGG